MSERRPGVGGLVVGVGGSRWFLPIAAVIEVLRRVEIIRVPGASQQVRGMVNHRGRILTVADALRALDLPGSGGEGHDVVVVEAAGRRFAVAVDAVVELTPEARTGLAELDLDRIATAIFV